MLILEFTRHNLKISFPNQPTKYNFRASFFQYTDIYIYIYRCLTSTEITVTSLWTVMSTGCYHKVVNGIYRMKDMSYVPGVTNRSKSIIGKVIDKSILIDQIGQLLSINISNR